MLLSLLPWAGGPRSRVSAQSAAVYSLPVQAAATQVRRDLEVFMLHLINNERALAGLRPITPHATIREAARRHAQEMFAFGYLSHRSRDGRTPQQRILDVGVRVRAVGENVAYATDIRAAHGTLMSSLEHRGRILSLTFRLVGVGVVVGGADDLIVVEDFAH